MHAHLIVQRFVETHLNLMHGARCCVRQWRRRWLGMR